MAKNSEIAWTDHTANFWWGCFKVSDGCKNCYAETLANRYGKSVWGPPATTPREMKQGVWKDLKNWDFEAKRAGVRRRVFVSSMSDFLENHIAVDPWREAAKLLLAGLQSLDVLLLTKRPENARKFLADWYGHWPAHIWFGVTAENQEMANERLPLLRSVPAKVRFVSVEPMLGPVSLLEAGAVVRYVEGGVYDIPLRSGIESNGLDWVICGGESGAKRRPFDLDWARALRDECASVHMPFFMKQDAGARSGAYDHLSDDLKIRQFPAVRL